MDYKLFFSILAKLELIIPELINPGQTGFIRGRQMQDNIRQTLQIISHVNQIINHIQDSNLQAVLLSLDAGNAFDSVNWLFLKRYSYKIQFS